MDIQDMRIFARVAAVQNLSAVGTELGLTPGTISKRIQALEDELSARLFDRTTRSIRITEEGATFLAHVERILSEIEAARASVDDKVSKPKGKLKIAAPACLGRRYVAPALCEFMRAYPEIDVQVDLRDRPVNLQEDGYDIAIRTGELSDSSLIAKRLAPDRHVIVASPAYIAAHGPPLRPEDLAATAAWCSASRRQWSFTKNGAESVGARQRPAQLQQRRAAVPAPPSMGWASSAPPSSRCLRAAHGQARAGARRLRGRHQRGRCGRSIRAPSTCCRACARCSISWPTGSARRGKERAGCGRRKPAVVADGANAAVAKARAARELALSSGRALANRSSMRLTAAICRPLRVRYSRPV